MPAEMHSASGIEVLKWSPRLDCCNREVISHVATTGGITGEMMRDLMIESVERALGRPHGSRRAIEWLSDNGSCYTARETAAFAWDTGFISCFTPVPVRSPE